MVEFVGYVCLILYYVTMCDTWKAIPANQAMYSVQSDYGLTALRNKEGMSDERLPRDQLNHIYKFGWCTPEATARQYFRKSINVTFPNWQSTQARYVYLLAKKHTTTHYLQCVVMKSYVPMKYLYYKSRLPLYYCQGIVYIMMLNTINRYEIHEFFFYRALNMPVNFSFEFYHLRSL